VVVDAGQELLSFKDAENGLAGYNSAILYLLNDANGYSPPGAASANWTSVWQSFDFPIDGRSLVKVSISYRWNPNSEVGGIALNSAFGRFGASEPGVCEARFDTVGITDYVRTNMGLGADFDLQLCGNGATAPTVYLVELIYEW
jgi:hypothetical protein